MGQAEKDGCWMLVGASLELVRQIGQDQKSLYTTELIDKTE